MLAFCPLFPVMNIANLLAICGYVEWLIISVVLCAPDLRVCDLFLELPVKQRLPLVILTSGQSNHSEWWGGHMLINIIILSMVEQRTLLLSCFVILVSAFVLLCGIFVYTVASVRNEQMLESVPLNQMYLCSVGVCFFTVKMYESQLSSWSPWAGWHKFIRGQTSRWTQQRAPNLNDTQTEILMLFKDNVK